MTNRFSILLLAKGQVRPAGGLLLPLLFFLTACANQGVIVRKDSGPMPMYHTLGMEGSYSFYLRDRNGAVHRQIVTPDVFARYSEGEYFNDLQPVPSTPEQFDPTTVRTHPYVAKHQSTFTLKRVVKTERTRTSPQRALAAKKRANTSRVAAASPRKKAVAKAVATKPVKAKSQQVKRATGAAKTKAMAAKTRKTKSSMAKKSSPKPWKITASVVETAPASTTTAFAGSSAENVPPSGEPIVSVAPDSP